MGIERDCLVSGSLSSVKAKKKRPRVIQTETKPYSEGKERKKERLDHTHLLNTGLKLQMTLLLIWDLNQRLSERHLVNESKAEMNHVF